MIVPHLQEPIPGSDGELSNTPWLDPNTGQPYPTPLNNPVPEPVVAPIHQNQLSELSEGLNLNTEPADLVPLIDNVDDNILLNPHYPQNELAVPPTNTTVVNLPNYSGGGSMGGGGSASKAVATGLTKAKTYWWLIIPIAIGFVFFKKTKKIKK